MESEGVPEIIGVIDALAIFRLDIGNIMGITFFKLSNGFLRIVSNDIPDACPKSQPKLLDTSWFNSILS